MYDGVKTPKVRRRMAMDIIVEFHDVNNPAFFVGNPGNIVHRGVEVFVCNIRGPADGVPKRFEKRFHQRDAFPAHLATSIIASVTVGSVIRRVIFNQPQHRH